MTTPIADGSVIVRGWPAPFHVRRSKRARRASLRIHPRRGIEVVLPVGASDRVVTGLLRDQSAWLDRHADDVHRAQRTVDLSNDTPLPVRGEWPRLCIQRARSPKVTLADGRLRIDTPTPRDEQAIRAQLERWYRSLARAVIHQRIDALVQPRDGAVRRVSIRDQDTCWGSCTEGGSLSFNWRLVMAPPPVLDAVVTHELVHLRILDHSPAFWRALDARSADHRRCRAWLDANAYRLGL